VERERRGVDGVVAELFLAAATTPERRGIGYLLGDGALLPFRGSGLGRGDRIS
jgi:hypothetical protein